jgi:chaperonin cofactor prefoldin
MTLEESITPEMNPDTENLENLPENAENLPLEPESTPEQSSVVVELEQQVEQLQQQKQTLEAEIKTLQNHKTQLIVEQMAELQGMIKTMIQEGVQELEQRKQTLQISVEQLERRRERIKEEMKTTFAGVSQDLAIRIQGFRDYLVGSLQDLVATAEQLELPRHEDWDRPQPQGKPQSQTQVKPSPQESASIPVNKPTFEAQAEKIQTILDQYRTLPDYYGPPWQLRRTFEPIHAERVRNWFFKQGGRGAIKTMGSRLQNILVASSVISVLYKLHGDRLKTLVLASTPERLGEWRRGLQDCLGISRSDFGPERGMVLFETPEALTQKAERLMDDQLLPLVIIDETPESISLSLLQFPLWLAFAPEPQQMSSYAW